MMRMIEVRCPRCKAGWKLAQPNALAVRLVEEALERHEAEHRKIAAARWKIATDFATELDGSRWQTLALGGTAAQRKPNQIA